MRRTSIVLFALLLFAAPAMAQGDDGPTIRVTGFAAPGTPVSEEFALLRVGGLVEQVWSNGLGFGVDLSYASTLEDIGEGIGMVAPAILYEFQTEGPIAPYVRGGPSILFAGGGGALLWHYGGGINYWVKESFGIKVEARHTFWSEAPTAGIFDVMIGGVFKF